MTFVIRREILTATPPSGDYILSPTGFSWSVCRSQGDGSGVSISAGERNKTRALATVFLLAEGDKADAWETVGTGSFWLIKRCRPTNT